MRILNMGNPDSFKNEYICQYFIDRGHELYFIGHGEPRKPLKGMEYSALKSEFLKFPKIKFFEFILKTRRLIKKIRPDVIHAHNVGTYGWLGSFSGFHPLVIQCFGGDLFGIPNRYHKWSTIYSLQRADRLIVTGKHMVGTLERVFNVERSRIDVLPRGIDLSIFRPFDNKEAFLKIHNLRAGPVIFSPRYLLDSVYNIDVIVKSVPLVKRIFPDIRYIQLFKEPDDQNVFSDFLDIIERSGISDNFIFLPVVDNREMSELYNAADLCVSIPQYDGFPVSILEGSACGVPFIVSDVPYTREWFENGKNGIILQEISPEALAAATIDLLKDEAKRKQMAAINREKVEEGFDYHKCMARLERIYLYLAGRDNVLP